MQKQLKIGSILFVCLGKNVFSLQNVLTKQDSMTLNKLESKRETNYLLLCQVVIEDYDL